MKIGLARWGACGYRISRIQISCDVLDGLYFNANGRFEERCCLRPLDAGDCGVEEVVDKACEMD